MTVLPCCAMPQDSPKLGSYIIESSSNIYEPSFWLSCSVVQHRNTAILSKVCVALLCNSAKFWFGCLDVHLAHFVLVDSKTCTNRCLACLVVHHAHFVLVDNKTCTNKFQKSFNIILFLLSSWNHEINFFINFKAFNI